jgi:hypothetical protein
MRILNHATTLSLEFSMIGCENINHDKFIFCGFAGFGAVFHGAVPLSGSRHS